MKIGLMGFGRTGRAVSSVLLQSRKTNLQWVMRKSRGRRDLTAPEILGIDSDEPGAIWSVRDLDAAELLDRHPVDVIVDFSCAEGIHYYGAEAFGSGILFVIDNMPRQGSGLYTVEDLMLPYFNLDGAALPAPAPVAH